MADRRASSSKLAHDPYELDRLAEELAEREERHSFKDQQSSSLDLPQLLPLDHDNPYLTAPEFSVEDFLLSRLYTSLPELRSELREYLAVLKEELVKLINDDYGAFISLSTDLRGEGARMERVNWPLEGLRARVSTSREQLQGIQDAVKDKLARRAALRDEKALLQLLMKISDSISRLESLLLITSPSENSAPPTNSVNHLNSGQFLDGENNEDGIKISRAKHFLRIASEYNQLLYSSEKALGEGCAFAVEMQWRIERIMSTLSSDLEHLFALTLKALVSSDKVHATNQSKPEVERKKLLADMHDCLRSYDMLGLWRDAEDVIAREVMRDFVKKTIFPGCLAAPPSPMVPHTPFHNTPFFASVQSSSQAPRTPYTPYTAFQSKANPFFAPSSTETSIYLLDDSDNQLAALYNAILRFVDREIKPIMEAAERISVQRPEATSAIGAPNGHAGDVLSTGCDISPDHGFDILASVVWTEIARGIMDDLGTAVFAVGRPEEFRKNYETTQGFIRSLEYLAPSLASVNSMRRRANYEAFERRWQLPVYFQLQWKDIVPKVEDALESKSLVPSVKSAKSESQNTEFVMSQSAIIWKSICRCWSAEVFIPDLGHRFWRLTLQLLKRYQLWLDNSLPPLQPIAAMKIELEKMTNSTSTPRLGTPAPSTQDSQERDEDARLLQFASVIQDILQLNKRVLDLWSREISVLLPNDEADEEDSPSEDVLKASLSNLTSLLPLISAQVEMVLIGRCFDALAPVKSLPGQFRAASQRHMPSKPSPFVPLILRPVKSFFGMDSTDGPGKALREEYCATISTHVFDEVANKYISLLSGVRKNQESLRRLRMGQRSGFSFFGGSSSNRNDEDRDEERVRKQLVLDVEAFGKDAQLLGVNISQNAAFKSLNFMAHADATDVETPS